MKFDRDKFFEGLRDWLGNLSQQQVDGCNALLTEIEADTAAETPEPLQWFAYMLATTYHETAHTFQPIEEYGKGRGRPYGAPDPETGQTYYGRGYVQLTWKSNYEKFGRLLSVDLLNHPELAMDPADAYLILSVGMIGGMFTGKKLADYISQDGTHADYHNARRIINGLDRADLIAGYANEIEDILTDTLITENSNG